jgi:hypothetical protein
VKDNTDRFGVNITRFMKTYDLELRQQLQRLRQAQQPDANESQRAQPVQPAQPDLPAIIARHEQILRWMEHERLIHLIVMVLTALFLMFSIFLALFLDIGLPGKVLVALAIILTAAYVIHYARLENTVQRWHRISLDLQLLANQHRLENQKRANQQIADQQYQRE